MKQFLMYTATLKGCGKSLMEDESDCRRTLHQANREVARQGRKTALIVRMSDAQRDELLSCLRAQKTPVGPAKRAWAMLLLADGQSYAATARQRVADGVVTGISPQTAGRGFRPGHFPPLPAAFPRPGAPRMPSE